MIDLKDKTCIVYDSNCYVEVAVRLARDFKQVYYYSHWQVDYPTSYQKSVGRGLEGEGVERINNFWDYIDKVDLIVFPDGNTGDLVDYLRNTGYRVWGSGKGEELEYDRVSAKEYMKHLKMPVNKYEVITGIDDLREYLKDEKNEDKFIKNDVRGSFESFHHQKWRLTEPILVSIEGSLGVTKNEFEFIVEDPIPDAAEWGYDGYSIDGQYSKEALFGIEVKDLGYVGKVKKYDEISDLITGPNEKLKPFLKKKKFRGFLSTEIRITPDKKNYLIDFTCRQPSPPGEIYQELWENYSEIIWFGADGILVEPIFTSKCAVEGIILSSWAAGDGEQAIYFPEEIRKWIKIKNLYKYKDTYYFLPVGGGYEQIGGVVALGETIDECVEKLKKYSEEIEGYKITIPIGSIDKAMEEVEKSKSLGIHF